MKSKKINDLSALGGFVFSTNKDFDFSENQEVVETPENNKQYLEAHLDKKNRVGKIATIIKGYEGTDQEIKNKIKSIERKKQKLKKIEKKIKNLSGVGRSQKDGEIINQRNFRNKIMEFLKKEGYNVKRVGG